MLQVDVLSGYTICGAGSLVGAAMLRIAEPNEASTQQSLDLCALGFAILGMALLPAALGSAATHTAVAFSFFFGTLTGITLLVRGMGGIQGQVLGDRPAALLVSWFALAGLLAIAVGPEVTAMAYAAHMAALTTLLAWSIRGLVLRPRDRIERALGASLLLLCASSWARLAFALAYDGPARLDFLHAPDAARSAFAVLYGILPMITASLLLTWVNARLRQQLRALAVTDELTGVMTRRALRDLAPSLIERARRLGTPTAILMLDLDHFKSVNDTHGHAMGDAVLKLAASTLKAQTRADALLARYGGEEFVCITLVADLHAARRIAERLRLAVAQVDWQQQLELPQGVTVSVGVAVVGPGETLDGALARADEALYRAKREGRDQCQMSLAAA